MPGKLSVSARVNSIVVNRTSLADALQTPEHAAAVARVGLLVDDLRAVSVPGHEAIRLDAIQQGEASEREDERQRMKADRAAFDTEADALRMRLPSVIRALMTRPETEAYGRWVAGLAIEHVRLRVTLPESGSEAPAQPERRMVPRRDRLTYARSVGQLVVNLLAEERAPVVEELARRGFERARLESLAQKAEGYLATQGGKLPQKALEATRLEAAAVAAQKVAWDAVRRQIREAVRGVPALEALYAGC